MKKRIGIVGLGYVGKAFYKFFQNHHFVVAYDVKFDHVNNHQLGEREFNLGDKFDINDCDVAVVCVPTPMKEDGSCDTSIVEEVIDWIACPMILLKSTVSPGTTKSLKEKMGKHIIFSPEYIGESLYWTPYSFHKDVIETPFFIFGGEGEDTSKMVDLFLPIAGPCKKYIQTSSESAELAKYCENCFYHTKIMFFYEFSRICEAHNVDWNVVRELFLLDPRVNPMHTLVKKDYVGTPVAGKCLVKDLSALIKSSQERGYDPHFLKEVRRTNDRFSNVESEDFLEIPEIFRKE